MPNRIANTTRDQLVTAFRYRICELNGIVPFKHQASWWAASDGLILTDEPDEHGMEVLLPDKSTMRLGVRPRPYGPARVIADLGSYKIGKSFGAAVWGASFGCIPDGRVQLVGLEYDIAEPEFSYLCELLLSERGLNMKYDSLQNRPRDGRMFLDLQNGCRFEAKSWERKDSLKGKEVDAMIFCEAYQLPGMECYTSFSQNLRARDGSAVFATTPDEPWINQIHECAHSGDPEFTAWHCTCDVGAEQNPFTFSAAAKERDRKLMTRDKFAIHYEGKLGGYVGRVYPYQRGSRTFSPLTHPDLFRKVNGQWQLSVPHHWEILCGADTGTFMSGLVATISPDGDVFVLAELPNYSYVSKQPELDGSVSIPSWCQEFRLRVAALNGRALAWCDTNSQFKTEMLKHGVHLLGNKVSVETRTKITQEYLQQDKLWLAPNLVVLPEELEGARWPDEATAAGKFQRLKVRDHTLDCLEHILSRRPRSPIPEAPAQGSWLETFGRLFPRRSTEGNVHLGSS